MIHIVIYIYNLFAPLTTYLESKKDPKPRKFVRCRWSDPWDESGKKNTTALTIIKVNWVVVSGIVLFSYPFGEMIQFDY